MLARLSIISFDADYINGTVGFDKLAAVTKNCQRVPCETYARYGKSRNSAGLNYGDCFSYALAKATGLPLLFKGEDFSKTDLLAALANT